MKGFIMDIPIDAVPDNSITFEQARPASDAVRDAFKETYKTCVAFSRDRDALLVRVNDLDAAIEQERNKLHALVEREHPELHDHDWRLNYDRDADSMTYQRVASRAAPAPSPPSWAEELRRKLENE